MGCRERTGISEGLWEGRDQSGAWPKPLLPPELGSEVRGAGLWEDGWACGVGVAGLGRTRQEAWVWPWGHEGRGRARSRGRAFV